MTSQQFTEGGCQADIFISPNGRTPEDIDESHQHMVDTYFPHAQYRTKYGEIIKHDDGYRKIKINWSQAYKHSQSPLENYPRPTDRVDCCPLIDDDQWVVCNKEQ